MYKFFKSLIFWNGFIRFSFEGYLELMINSLINIEIIIKRYKSKDYILNQDLMEPIEYWSTLLTFFYSAVLILLPFFCAIYLKIY